MKKTFLTVAKCYPTKSPDAKYSHILHLTMEVSVPVVDEDGEIVGHNKKTIWLRQGFDTAVPEGKKLGYELDKYQVTSYDTKWEDPETKEEMVGKEHWLTPKSGI